MKQPKLLIFDCDGVVVDSEEIGNRLFLGDLQKYWLQLTMADCDRLFVGGTFASAMSIARNMGADLPDDWVDRFYDKLYQTLENGVRLVDGVSDVLNQVDAAGITHCIVSNGSERKMQITLGQNGLWDRFEGKIFSAHRYKTAKPDPELLYIAARAFDVDPADCTVIDDSPSGCTAAARAGMRCIGFAERSDPKKLAATGAHVIRSMAELPALLGLSVNTSDEIYRQGTA